MDESRDYDTKWHKSQKGEYHYDITYMWNLKYDTNELIYETETDSLTQEADLWLPRELEGGREMNWEFGISRCKLLHTEWINNKVPLQSTWISIQYV